VRNALRASTGREGVPATEEDTRDESTEQAAAEQIFKRSRGNAGWVAFSSFDQARIGCSDRDTGENRDSNATGSNELLQRRIRSVAAKALGQNPAFGAS
jgi:hypothetical protein